MANEEAKRFLRLVFSHIVQSVQPKKLVQNTIKFERDNLLIGTKPYHVSNNCYIVGFGKAVLEMASEVYVILDNNVRKGILSIPETICNSGNCHDLTDKVFKIFRGAKDNIPDVNSFRAAKEILELAKPLNSSDILLVMISGGGSALITQPIPPVTLQDKIAVTKLLSYSGADISEMNTVRKQLSMIKGGKLMEVAFPCQVISLVLSDVINDPLGSIASGPTVINEDASGTGLRILQKYNLMNNVSDHVLSTLKNFKNEQKVDVFDNSHVYIIGNNSIALASGKSFIESRNKICNIITNQLRGNVVDVADAMSQLAKCICILMKHTNKEEFLKQTSSLSLLNMSSELVESLFNSAVSANEIFLLFGGETTVKVKGKGQGGRNMELALLFCKTINDIIEKEKLDEFEIIFLSAGTDGIDGPTDSAGAVTYKGQAIAAKEQGLDIENFLLENDSYNFFKAFNNSEDLITIGHTGTNVMDIMMLHIQHKHN